MHGLGMVLLASLHEYLQQWLVAKEQRQVAKEQRLADLQRKQVLLMQQQAGAAGLQLGCTVPEAYISCLRQLHARDAVNRVKWSVGGCWLVLQSGVMSGPVLTTTGKTDQHLAVLCAVRFVCLLCDPLLCPCMPSVSR